MDPGPTARSAWRSAHGLNATMIEAGIPEMALPGQYVAACICACVCKVNRLVAASVAPECFDAVEASGLAGPASFNSMDKRQVVSLVEAYSSGWIIDPDTGRPLTMDDHRIERIAAGENVAARKPTPR